MEDPDPNPFSDDTDPRPQQQNFKVHINQVTEHMTGGTMIASINGDVTIQTTVVYDHRGTNLSTLKSNFIGREKEITDIQNLDINQKAKIIVIQAAAGVGKTTLAQQYIESQGYKLVRLNMAKETENIEQVDSIVADCLKNDFNVNSVQELNGNLKLLSRKLKAKHYSQKIGILIDNLEPALDRDGKFIEKHRGYAELLKVLADSQVHSLTLITSRETLREDIYNIQQYPLCGLSIEAWQEFFKSSKIKADDNDLEEINQAYGGNAKAMGLIAGQILLSRKEKIVDPKIKPADLNQYWQKNKERLLRNTLEDLFKDTFTRLQLLHPDAYRLLCRLGYCRYQKVPTLAEEGLFSLLWDIQEEDRIKIIDSLINYFLVEQKNDEYYLHPVIRAEAIRKIELNREEWKEINIRIADFYCRNARDITQSNQDRVTYAFEAIYHYDKIGEHEKCHKMLLCILEAEENLENLRCSENLWSYIITVIETCKDLTDEYKLTGRSKLDGLSKAITLIPLGVLYPEMGKTKEAVQKSEEILKIIGNISEYNSEDYKKIIFAKISAHLISARANKFLGNFPKAFEACDKAIELVMNIHDIDKSTLNYWHGLAVYERGTVHLERAKLRESSLEACQASWYIAKAAYLAVDITKPSRKLYAYLITIKIIEINKILKKIKKTIDDNFARRTNQQRDNDYTKKFRVIYNFGRCLNLIDFYLPPMTKRFFLNLAEGFLPETDYLNKTWSYLELALCSSREDATKYYEKASEEENFSCLTTLCQASVLFEHGNFKYKQEYYLEAINKYLELEEFLNRTDFESLKVRNYNNICKAFSNISDDKREEINGNMRNISEYLEDSKRICKKIELDL
jgi:hypothetical protein